MDVPGGGFSPAADLGEETWKNTPGALYRGLGSKMIARKPLALKSLLDDGYGVAIQIVRPQENGRRDSHVVSLWGYTYNGDEPFRGVYITDSDDDKKSRSSRKAKNRLRHYGVVFKDGSWWFQAATDYEGWRILAAYGLARMPTESSSGKERSLTAEGALAMCVQHEMDHLSGVLFVDHLSRIKRSIILRKLVKTRKLAAAAE